MYDIQLNESGTRHMTVCATQLATIKRHRLFDGLENSTGFVTEAELDKLKLNLRSLIASRGCEDTKDLLDLCIDIFYHDKMKAFGLRNLIAAYKTWEKTLQPEADAAEQPEA